MKEQKAVKINYIKLVISMLIAGVVGFFISYLIFGVCEGSRLSLTEIISGDLDRITLTREDSIFRSTCLDAIPAIKRTMVISTMLILVFGGILNLISQLIKKINN